MGSSRSKKGENDAFSHRHGAGRKLSRTAARNTVIDPEALVKELEDMGIIVRAKTRSLLSEGRQRHTRMWTTW